MHPHLLYPTCVVVLAASFGAGLLLLPPAGERPKPALTLAAAGTVDIAPAPQNPPVASPSAPLAAPPRRAMTLPDASPAAALLAPADATSAGRFSQPEPVAPSVAPSVVAKGADATPDVLPPETAKPAAKAADKLRRKQARRDFKQPAGEALRTVRRFGDNLQDIPVTSFAADGSRRRIMVRPTSIQDVYYYSARQ